MPVRDAVTSILPALTLREMASGVFADPTLKSRLVAKVEKSIERRGDSCSPQRHF